MGTAIAPQPLQLQEEKVTGWSVVDTRSRWQARRVLALSQH
jgi:hypothetical protein